MYIVPFLIKTNKDNNTVVQEPITLTLFFMLNKILRIKNISFRNKYSNWLRWKDISVNTFLSKSN